MAAAGRADLCDALRATWRRLAVRDAAGKIKGWPTRLTGTGGPAIAPGCVWGRVADVGMAMELLPGLGTVHPWAVHWLKAMTEQ